MNKTVILLLLTILSVYCHEQNQIYAHDEIQHGYKLVPPDFLKTFDDVYGDRHLQKSSPQPMRITVDYKELDNPKNGDGMTPQVKDYIRKIMEATQIYLGKLIKVNRRTAPIKMTWGDTCFDMKVTQQIQDVGQPDSDLHIYVSYINKPEFSFVANAIHCQLDPTPVVGRVQFNIAKMAFNDEVQIFQNNFFTSLHEILHILGFSGHGINYWIDPETGKPYGDNIKKLYDQVERWGQQGVNKVTSKNILRVARNHYACPSIDGMYLENQGGSGSMGSHWERDLLGNEFMTASVIMGTFTFSEFTAALLLDTGYYAEINSNMLMPVYWGKNKGCDFFHKTCNAGIDFPEFPDLNTQETCDFNSVSPVTVDKFDGFSQCALATHFGYSCQNANEYPVDERLRQNSGPGARCFRSNAAAKGEEDQELKARCFKAQCAADNQSIDVTIWGTEKVNCKYPNQVINLDNDTKTTQGIMKCPTDFDQFCNFPSYCPNQCSRNGVCNNGVCICLLGWAGEDCSKQCPVSSAWDGSRCVPRCPSGTFKNNDNVCKSTCPYKYYKDTNTSTCELCHVNCSVCSGPASNQCTVCNNEFTLSGNSCVEAKCHASCNTCSGPSANQCNSCPTGKYLDSNKACQSCKSPCNTCFNDKVCTSCVSGYFMNQMTGQCTPENTCDDSCKTCSNFRDASSCTSCRDNYTLIDGFCTKCSKSCKRCSGAAAQCTECASGYTYDAPNQRCYMECDPACSECSQAKNPKACTSCSSSKYLKDGQCLPCVEGCSTCKGSATFCVDCSYGYTLDEKKNVCNSICRPKEFMDSNDERCKPCNSTCGSCKYYDYLCTSCIAGYALDERQNCRPSTQTCHNSCKTCKKFNDDRACDSCNSGMYLQNGSCLACPRNCSACNSGNSCQTCQSGFQLQNGQCTENVSTQCHSSCKTCSSPPSGNRTFCTSCSDGSFLNGDMCSPCQLPCKTCLEASYYCTSCDENQYSFNQRNRSCDAKTCHPSCKSCSKPNDSFSCQSCNDGYYLKGQACQACSQNCKTCGNDANQCTSCASGFTLNNGKCTQQSQPTNRCDASCATCSRDNDAMGCLSCKGNNWLQSNADKSLGRCLPCDPSCNGCTDTYRCIACSAGNVMNSNGSCYPKRNLQTNIETITQTFVNSKASLALVSISSLIILFISIL